MTEDCDAPLETEWSGKYISVLRRGRWEFVSRTGSTNAVVVLAEHDGKVILIEQYRVPVGGRCLEPPAGLVGDEDEDATLEETAIKELEEETGFTADGIEILGDFHSSPGMVAESFTWFGHTESGGSGRAAATSMSRSTCTWSSGPKSRGSSPSGARPACRSTSSCCCSWTCEGPVTAGSVRTCYKSFVEGGLAPAARRRLSGAYFPSIRTGEFHEGIDFGRNGHRRA